jgi:hypothetical protein
MAAKNVGTTKSSAKIAAKFSTLASLPSTFLHPRQSAIYANKPRVKSFAFSTKKKFSRSDVHMNGRQSSVSGIFELKMNNPSSKISPAPPRQRRTRKKQNSTPHFTLRSNKFSLREFAGRKCKMACSRKLSELRHDPLLFPVISSKSEFHIPSERDFPVGWRWLARFITLFVTSRNRWRTSRRERKRLIELARTIATLREQQTKARENRLIHRDRILNVGLYLLLMDRDFSVLKMEMVSTLDHWRLRYAARQIGLLTYESCDDLTSLLDKDFRHSLAAVELPETEMHSFNVISRQLNEFKNKNQQCLYNQIRNVVSAHRAQDSLEFLNAIDAIDPFQIFRLAGDFFDIVRSLIRFLVRATQQTGQPHLIVKQVLESRSS